jgi:hypothetical protein
MVILKTMYRAFRSTNGGDVLTTSLETRQITITESSPFFK